MQHQNGQQDDTTQDLSPTSGRSNKESSINNAGNILEDQQIVYDNLQKAVESQEKKKGSLSAWVGDGGEATAEQIQEKVLGLDQYSRNVQTNQEDEDEDEGPKRPQEPPLYEYSYRISLSQFAAFEEFNSREIVRRDKKRKAIVGAIEVAFSLFYLYQMIRGVFLMNFGNFMVVAMFLGWGMYTMLYYRFFYEKRKKLAVEMHYTKNEYLQSEITLSIYENCFVERAADVDTVHYWHSIFGVRELTDCFHLLIQERWMILVPKPENPEESKKLRDHLLDSCDRFEKGWYSE